MRGNISTHGVLLVSAGLDPTGNTRTNPLGQFLQVGSQGKGSTEVVTPLSYDWPPPPLLYLRAYRSITPKVASLQTAHL